jgi:hypothetical protein
LNYPVLSKFCSVRVQFLNSLWLISQDRIGRAARFISPFLNVSQLVGPSKKTVPRMTQDSWQAGTDAAPHLADKEQCPSLVPGMSSYESLSQDMGVVKCTWQLCFQVRFRLLPTSSRIFKCILNCWPLQICLISLSLNRRCLFSHG